MYKQFDFDFMHDIINELINSTEIVISVNEPLKPWLITKTIFLLYSHETLQLLHISLKVGMTIMSAKLEFH